MRSDSSPRPFGQGKIADFEIGGIFYLCQITVRKSYNFTADHNGIIGFFWYNAATFRDDRQTVDNVMIKGDKIKLIPAALDDRQKVYEWCFQSETTKYHAGPPDYPNNPIPSYEEFYASDAGGYTDYYFTGAKPDDGRGFLIINEDEAVGFVSYCAFHLKPAIAELDIWMNAEANCGNGFGVDALISLGDYLNKERGFRELIIAPSIKNTRAVKAYEKAGFKKTDKVMSDFLLDEYISLLGGGDYGADETVILVKQFYV